MNSLGRFAFVASLIGLATTACSSSDKPSSTAGSTSTTRASSAPPAASACMVVRGAATLDGAPVDSKFVGAVVLDHGLVTPCQVTLPPVREGNYSVGLYAATESVGCGAPGTRVAVWIFAHNRILFSTNTVAWPAASGPVSLDATYSTAKPRGATPAVAQFQGGAFAADGSALPAGTRVEAYVGTTRCGVASVRSTQDFTGYILSVVGPDAIPGCTNGAPITFRLNGKPATPTGIPNTPPGRNETLDLKVA